jgi:hypothetical protein
MKISSSVIKFLQCIIQVTGGWRKLHNEELQNLYNYNNQVMEDVMSGACSTHGDEEECILGYW